MKVRITSKPVPRAFAAMWVTMGLLGSSWPAPGAEAPAPKAASIESVAWMAGSWGEDGKVIEYWMPPVGGLMVGVNRPLEKGGEKSAEPFFEFLRMEERDDGVFLVAAPRGRGETAFRLTDWSETSAVFENPQHDFPQRISYRLEDSALVADVQAKKNGEWSGFSLRWERLDGQVGGDAPGDGEFPVRAELLTAEFGGSEGLAFNGEGNLFVTANRALWQVYPDGQVRKVADLHSNLGLASIGKRDLLVADFGPTNAFRHDRNDDGLVWRITPEGEKTEQVTGLGDPNFLLLRKDGSLLISDDATADIYIVEEGDEPRLFSTAVNHPNGLALSDDGRTLYVAQIFKSVRPVVPDDSLWAIPLGGDGSPVGAAELVARLGPYAANDGLAMDVEGRVYIAANGKAGEVWRFDPETAELVLIARDIYGAASIAFGEGDFDPQSIYVSTTFNKGRGGKIWRVPVGVTGQPVTRFPTPSAEGAGSD
ncbi:MAG: SMP-30/gluconolactonase/LRE family protein [Deltaproteobacteria bacterium]|nr:SMP-30/gluconolactonase/LRE family protein [Deltaproteobacteria bacterium]